MRLNKLSLKDEALFSRYLSSLPHELCAYSFCNIYIWKKLFEIEWLEIEGNLCVFFQDKIGCFLYLAPLGEKISPAAVEEAFKIMDSRNSNPQISRIENIEALQVDAFRRLGFPVREKFNDYLCLRKDLIELKGNKFKAKRACVNYFCKNYAFEYLPYELFFKDDCLRLLRQWIKARSAANREEIYRMMLEDNASCLEVLLGVKNLLGACGSVVRIGGQVKGFTFGFPVSEDIFCVLFEITDLKIKGLAQFIFRQFCRDAGGYKYINIMDDSGLANLKKVKLSYHPQRLVPAYIASR